jgi:cyclohexanone monooxygenase
MKSVDAVVVGAGFAGLYMVHRLRAQGLSLRAFEAGPDVGGTWFWNRYPGARCDVESLEYAYSFLPELETEWRWSERFATQPEILRYINHVADRLDLRSAFTFETRVTAAQWREELGAWQVTAGSETLLSRYLIMATGCLSTTTKPAFPGIDEFRGTILHTGEWPEEPPVLEGKRVGVIGTGSSGVQAIPELAKAAGHLTVFQRTPHFCVPARNAPLREDQIARWHADFPELRRRAREETRSGWLPDPPAGSALDASPAQRQAEYDWRWAKGGGNFLYAYNDIGSNEAANATAADYVRERIRETVKDPATAARLVPQGYPIGAKRICVGTDFYETFNRANVTLADVASDPIVGLTPAGLRTRSREYELDVIVFATGFDAITGAILKVDIVGPGGRLADAWADGPVNTMGLMVHGFPNLFTITGPGSPSVLSNVICSIEQHVEWISDLLAWMGTRGFSRIEPSAEAQAAWVEHCAEVAGRTLMGRANSWYMGANIPGKPRVFLPYIGGVDAYRRHCNAVAADNYRGFQLGKVAAAA